MKTNMYTDLAIELQEECSGNRGEIAGVILEKHQERTSKKNDTLTVTEIEIQTKEGAERMGKPIGKYLTIEINEIDCPSNCSEILASHLKRMMPSTAQSILFVGLGNANMTADALGPQTMEKLALAGMASHAAMMTPGVFAQTGMESSDIIKGIVQKTKPDCIVTVDALAARSAFRLGKTIQITDTGIRPGSGVGNTRKGINKETMGIPVIAIGIPTVVSAAAIVSDAMDALKQIGYNEHILGSIAMLDQEEYYQLISEVFAPNLGTLFVMSRNLDEELDQMSCLLAEALQKVV